MTLRNFFDNNQSISDTANAMYLHRNTISYRLNKIRKIIEDDFDNPLIRLHMYISFIIDDISI
ncbi:helix-turn-helix domain-containing protein [Clostridium neonatale]|uniref:PucR family transcriptional regulator n=1 Tax=Clostridium neonatale TaxID=137838 RepID=UPI0037423CEE